jgi:hypothetical protein
VNRTKCLCAVVRTLLVTTTAVIASTVVTPPASAATWGACGVGTEESKLVAQYMVNARTNVYRPCNPAVPTRGSDRVGPEADMARTQHDPVAEIVRSLRAQGFTVEPTGHGDEYVLGSDDGTLARRPLLSLPPDLLSEYLEQTGRNYRDAADPLAEALSLTMVHLIEELETDHHEGRNYVRALGLRRDPHGRVELFVEQDLPDVPRRPFDADLEWRAH